MGWRARTVFSYHAPVPKPEGAMITFIHESDQVTVPEGVVDLESFRRWAEGDDFPDNGRIWFLKGEVWVDMSREQVFTHLMVKNQFYMVLGSLVESGELGLYVPDGLFLCNVHADMAANPDATFASTDSLRSNRVRLIEGKKGGFVELEGSPDMVLEVISPTSGRKDRVLMRQAYWEAEISEYWLVDALRQPLQFDIFRRAARGYVATRKHDGWLRSSVFGKSFRLTQRTNALGHPQYKLAVR
jgi:Uma2 family endonuclease